MLKKYKIENLDCPNCANKMEKMLNDLTIVREASINFPTQSLLIDTDDICLVQKEIDRIEPGVVINGIDGINGINGINKINDIESHSKKEKINKFINKDLSLIIAGTLLFTIALITRHFGQQFGQFQLTTNHWIEAIIFLPAYILLGKSIITKAIRNSLRGQLFDEYFLMSIATIGAFIIGASAEAVTVMLFYQIGEYFQGRAINKSRMAIKGLLEIRPDKANLLINERDIKEVHPKEIKVGEIIVVRPGEKIPLDGIVIKGESWLDTSALTGESVAKPIKSQQEVLAGMINKTGVLTVKVDRPYNQSSIYKILELVESAVQKKAPLERFLTKLARYYTPLVVFIAFAIATIPPLFIANAIFSEWIYRALVILVISCPCALVISIPLGYFGGIGAASKNGILIKGASYLDVLRKIKTVVFDKTGTLTEGQFSITDIKIFNGFTKEEILRAAAIAEHHSNHPLGEIIRKSYGTTIPNSLIEDHQEIPGLGVKALAEGNRIVVGNDKMLHLENIPHEICSIVSTEVNNEVSTEVNNEVSIENGTVVHVGINNKYVGYIEISDKIRTDAHASIKELRRLGVEKIIMLTGDREDTAKMVARKLDIDTYYAELLPENKLSILENIIHKNKSKSKSKSNSTNQSLCMFVGDGINDAPVIARADVGVSMGNIGSDTAIEISDVVIVNDSLAKIPQAIRIGKKTHNIVIQNVIFSFAVKFAFVALGAVGVATMWEAVFADMGVTLIAIFNAIRTQRNATSI
ncbi:MAG: heavy metal translocating P-type ATPase [Oligoflexia bacterium]|nr:heavy metal translocating P-type ATPase [Oligoflexia bacterium]